MKSILYLFSILVFILSACSASVEPTPTAEPTMTPEPTLEPVYLEGKLFFDKNATGLQDEATYLPCTNQRCDAISEMEPGLEGFEVCTTLDEETYCATTSSQGGFSLELPANQQESFHIEINDPNQDIPEKAMRFINLYEGTVVVPAYTLKGKEGWNLIDGTPTEGVLDPAIFYQGEIPEQTLYDTKNIKLGEGIDLKIGDENILGLMNERIVYPFRLEDFDEFTYNGGFDHDESEEGVIDFIGNTSMSKIGGLAYFICTLEENSDSPFICTLDSHSALDFGYKGLPKGIPLFAAEEGYVTTDVSGDGSIVIQVVPTPTEELERLDLSDNKDNLILLNYGHCDSSAVANYDFVKRGQLIGFIGDTGYTNTYPHVHLSAQYGGSFSRNCFGCSEFTKDFFAMTIPEFVTPGFNDHSIWTEWNQPIFYPIELELEWTR